MRNTGRKGQSIEGTGKRRDKKSFSGVTTSSLCIGQAGSEVGVALAKPLRSLREDSHLGALHCSGVCRDQAIPPLFSDREGTRRTGRRPRGPRFPESTVPQPLPACGTATLCGGTAARFSGGHAGPRAALPAPRWPAGAEASRWESRVPATVDAAGGHRWRIRGSSAPSSGAGRRGKRGSRGSAWPRRSLPYVRLACLGPTRGTGDGPMVERALDLKHAESPPRGSGHPRS